MRLKSVLLVAAPLVVVGAVALAVTSFVRGGGAAALVDKGFGVVETWCGDQLTALANDWLRPELSFTRLELELPRTVILHDARLVDEGVTFIAVDQLKLVLKETPKRGEPLIIEHVQLQHPEVSLVTRGDGSIIGFSPFIDGQGERSADGGSTKASDVFAIRKFTIEDGAFNWTASDGTKMTLDDLSFVFANEPSEQPGLYQVDASVVRAPILEANLKGALDIDNPGLAIEKLDASIDLSTENRESLPPAMQQLLGRHEIHGQLDAVVSGSIPFTEAASSVLDATLHIAEAHVLVERYEIPVRELTATVRLSDRKLDIEPLQATVFDGTLSAEGHVALSGDFATQVALDGRDMKLETAIRTFSEGTPQFAGKTTVKGNASMALRNMPSGLTGQGTVEIVDGTLTGDKVFAGLMEDMGRKEAEAGTDQARTDFTLHPDHIGMTDIRLLGGDVAARGEGELGFDGHINYRFNAGPLEKLEHDLGAVGELLAAVTDRVVTYQVTGQFGQPEFNTRPLGIGVVPGRD